MKLQALEWNAALATGIPVVDEQHQRLLGIFNEALVVQTEGASLEQTTSLLESLFDYARYHFREEAQLMRKWAVDEAHRITHLEAHERFIAFLKQTRGLAARHPAEFTAELLGFLARWLLHHIMGLDATMARAIRARQGELAPASKAAPRDEVDAQQYLFDLMGQLTDELGQRTFDLLDQRDRLLEQSKELLALQDLYRALLRSADILIRSHSEPELLESLCATLTQDTPFHTAWIGRLGTSQVFDTLALAGSGGQQVRESPPRLGSGPETSIVARAWDAQQVVVCNDPQADTGLRPWHEGFAAHGWASLLAAPVLRGSHPWAVLVFVSGLGGAFKEGVVALCARIAQLIGHGLDSLDRKSALQQRNVELEAVNQELSGAQTQLLQSAKMASVGQLAAGVAHEINNPIGYVRSNLTTLTGYVQKIFSLLQGYEQLEKVLPKAPPELAAVQALKQQVELDYIRTDIVSLLAESVEGVTRVEKIVKDLKDFSHVDQAEWQQVDVHDCIDSTLNVVGHELRYKANVIKEYGQLPPIECFPFQIQQVFMNLLVNAAQAIEGHGTVTICSGCEGDTVWVSISDTGKGIAPANVDRIFEPFFTTKPVGVGTGLGLSVSYGIIQKHGGAIDVASKLGGGTTLTVRLPIAQRRGTTGSETRRHS